MRAQVSDLRKGLAALSGVNVVPVPGMREGVLLHNKGNLLMGPETAKRLIAEVKELDLVPTGSRSTK